MDNLYSVLNNHVQPGVMPLVERGWVPDSALRFGMRRLLESTLKMVQFDGDVEKQSEYLSQFIADLKQRNIAEQTKAANEQHYEVPAGKFRSNF